MRALKRPLWPAVAALAALLVSVVLLASSAVAATERNVPTGVEAWYHVSPLADPDEGCALPTGCPAPPVAPYPDDTLHVGITAGRDNARTFITLNTKRLPAGAQINGGALHLPVAGSDAGTLRLQAAQLVACPVIQPFNEVRGGPPDEQPQFSCETSAPAKLDADADPPAFRVDLEPLASTLSLPGTGIALVPSPGARESAQTWRVVFSAKDRDAEEAKPITADLRYSAAPDLNGGSIAPPPEPPPPDPPPAAPNGSFDAGFGPAVVPDEVAEGSGPLAPIGGAAAAPAADAPVAAGPEIAAPAPVATAAPLPYMYPGVWLVPLIIAALAGALGQSLTTEMPVPAAAAKRRGDVLGRAIAALEALRTPTTEQPATPR